MPAGYVSETTTLETGAATKGPGTYNLVGNWNKRQSLPETWRIR